MKFSKKTFYIIIAGVSVISLLIGYFSNILVRKSQNPNLDISPIRQSNSNYQFVDPLIAYNNPKSNDTDKYKPYMQSVEQIIIQASANNSATDVSVYLRDLKLGSWVGINEDKNYSPASLLKVPVMIAYLKISETKPEILDKTVVINANSIDDLQNIQPSQTIQTGKAYSVSDLIGYMIKYSDNDASATLRTIISPTDLQNAYTDLGFKYPGDDLGDIMSVKNYALYFRLLYNGTYINPDLSERALKMLSETDYKGGIVAGVPEDIKVAHKFGERKTIHDNQPESQLHDCGIVYLPSHPYLLCVMTKGTDLEKLSGVIKDISTKTYDFESKGEK